MIEQLNQTDDKQEARKLKRAARRKNARKKITKQCCSQCGQPKHYICLEHNPYKKRSFFKRLPSRVRYYSRKFYFNLATRIGLAE